MRLPATLAGIQHLHLMIAEGRVLPLNTFEKNLIEIDPPENEKPSKKKSAGRIDGVSATVTALARALE